MQTYLTTTLNGIIKNKRRCRSKATSPCCPNKSAYFMWKIAAKSLSLPTVPLHSVARTYTKKHEYLNHHKGMCHNLNAHFTCSSALEFACTLIVSRASCAILVTTWHTYSNKLLKQHSPDGGERAQWHKAKDEGRGKEYTTRCSSLALCHCTLSPPSQITNSLNNSCFQTFFWGRYSAKTCKTELAKTLSYNVVANMTRTVQEDGIKEGVQVKGHKRSWNNISV